MCCACVVFVVCSLVVCLCVRFLDRTGLDGLSLSAEHADTDSDTEHGDDEKGQSGQRSRSKDSGAMDGVDEFGRTLSESAASAGSSADAHRTRAPASASAANPFAIEDL